LNWVARVANEALIWRLKCSAASSSVARSISLSLNQSRSPSSWSSGKPAVKQRYLQLEANYHHSHLTYQTQSWGKTGWSISGRAASKCYMPYSTSFRIDCRWTIQYDRITILISV
jgi:hypothetical protein